MNAMFFYLVDHILGEGDAIGPVSWEDGIWDSHEQVYFCGICMVFVF